MKKLIIFALLPMIIAIMTTGCKKATVIKLSDDTLSVGVGSHMDTVMVMSDGSWSLGGCPDWVNIDDHGQVLIFNTAENTTGKDRKVTITIGAGSAECKLVVMQRGQCTFIEPNTEAVSLPMEGGEQTVTILTDGAKLKVECKDFDVNVKDNKLTVKATEPCEKGLISDVKLSCDTIECVFKVVQKGKTCAVCKGSKKIICPTCGGDNHTNRPCPECKGVGFTMCCGGSGLAYCPVRHQADGFVTCPYCK